MSSSQLPPSHHEHALSSSHDGFDEALDLRDIFLRLTRGLYQIIAWTLLGIIAGALISLVLSRIQPSVTSTRVTFSFPGFERGEYPDKSKFQSDDIRAPAIIAEALKRQGLDTSTNFQSKVRGAISIEGVIPQNIVKERDRLRAIGQTPPPFLPDEFTISLAFPHSVEIGSKQRVALLNEIVKIYRENFTRTYGSVPLAFGTAFAALRNADFPEYQLVLDKEIESITAYLEQLISASAGTFRSNRTNLSFKDLLEHTQLFSQIQLNESLGLIYQNGLSKDRSTALIKMDYYLRVLDNQERRAVEEDKVVTGLLKQAQDREQNYVLGIKSQAAQPKTDNPILDQGLIDSLLANDAYNFLVRRALDAGLKVKQIQSEKARLLELRRNMSSFVDKDLGDQAAMIAHVNDSLKNLETAYNDLIREIRDTYADFVNQQYGNAVRISAPVITQGMLRPMAIAGVLGGFLGFSLGAGLSLLGIYVGKSQQA